MRRSNFALSICLILSVVIGLSVLSSCGGGGGSRPVTKPGDEVIITPPGNRAPVVSQAFENVVQPIAPVSQWESELLGNYFSDPDDDTLRFTADVDNPNVASVEFSDTGLLIVRAQGSGTATITVTATDPDGLSAAQSFTVTTTLDNRPPTTVRTFEDIVLILSDDDPSSGRWASGYLDAYFSDPESGRLSYEWLSSDESIAVVRNDGALQPPAETNAGTPLGLVAEARVAGIATVSVTATDPHGATVTQRFSIVVVDDRGVVGSPPADHSDTPAGATRITSGETVRGDLHSPDDVDWFLLEVAELSAVDVHFFAPSGTEISLLDLDGNVLDSGVSQSYVKIVTVALGKVLLRVKSKIVKLPGGNSAYSFIARRIDAVAKLIRKKIPIRVIPAGTHASTNIKEFLSCKLFRQDNNEEIDYDRCEANAEITQDADVLFRGKKVLTFSISAGGALRLAVPCQANSGKVGFSFSSKITIPFKLNPLTYESDKVEETITVGKADPEKCRPQEKPGGPEFSISANPGESVSITLTDYIRDPRDGMLSFTPIPQYLPSEIRIDRIDENDPHWSIRISTDAKVGDTSMLITATSAKDDIELSSDFAFRLSIACRAQVMFNDHDRWTPSASFTSALLQSEYNGDCKNGRANGQGIFDAIPSIGQSLSYDGAWEDGEPRGEGEWHINTILSERYYKGDWQDRRPHGLGTGSIEYISGNTERYAGDWIDGEPHGQGTWTALTDGDRYHYVGAFRNGLQHGRGIETNRYANGDRERLDGEFRYDVIWRGTATWNGVSCPVIDGEWDC